MNYASISSFGSNAHSEAANPLTYCMTNQVANLIFTWK